jgi:hypothetical protein
MKRTAVALLLMATLLTDTTVALAESDVYDRVQHGYADSGGVKIHYASAC